MISQIQETFQTRHIIIGVASFKQTFNKEIVRSSKNGKKKLKQNNWIINGIQYKDQNWKQIFASMFQCNVRSIRLTSTLNCQIIKQIDHIQFQYLTQLNLYENNINNVESLTYMNFQNLDNLSLNTNKIVSITSFKRISLKKLKWFTLQQNLVKQMTSLSQVLSSDNLSLHFETIQDSSNLCQDLSQTIKIKSNGLINNWFLSNQRIKQKKINQIFQKMYINLLVLT